MRFLVLLIWLLLGEFSAYGDALHLSADSVVDRASLGRLIGILPTKVDADQAEALLDQLRDVPYLQVGAWIARRGNVLTDSSNQYSEMRYHLARFELLGAYGQGSPRSETAELRRSASAELAKLAFLIRRDVKDEVAERVYIGTIREIMATWFQHLDIRMMDTLADRLSLEIEALGAVHRNPEYWVAVAIYLLAFSVSTAIELSVEEAAVLPPLYFRAFMHAVILGFPLAFFDTRNWPSLNLKPVLRDLVAAMRTGGVIKRILCQSTLAGG